MNALLLFRGCLGDAIAISPALTALRRRWPSLRITLVGLPVAERVLRWLGLIDGFQPIEEEPWASFVCGDGHDPLCWSLVDAATLVISLLSDQDGILLRKMQARGRRHLRLDDCWQPNGPPAFLQDDLDGPHPVYAWFARYLSPCDLPPIAAPHIVPNEQHRRQAIDALGSDLPNIMTVHPGASHPGKCWDPERWGAVITRLTAIKPVIPVILCGPADLAATRAVVATLGGCRHHVLHELDLGVVAAVISHARLHCGHDTGLSHLAAAVGAPVLALFGPGSDPLLWGPPGARVIHEPTSFDCINVDAVVRAALSLLR